MRLFFFICLCVLYKYNYALASQRSIALNTRRNIKNSPYYRSNSSEKLRLLAASVPIDDEDDVERKSTVASASFSLAKGILGAGMLSLPSGVASLSDRPLALLPISILIILMGVMSNYTFKSIGYAVQNNNVHTFEEAWAATVDKKSARWVSFLIAFKTFFTCLSYSIVIGDSFNPILKTISGSATLSNRPAVILALTVFFIFPLCLLKSLDALKYTSIIGMMGTLYCPMFMSYRLFDGSYQPGGVFHTTLPTHLQPSFNEVGGHANPLVIFQVLAMISTAYVAHYNAPQFINELENPTKPRFNSVVNNGFVMSVAMYIFVAFVGFLTFGGNSAGLILNNYSTADILATIGRAAVGLGVLCGYPLVFHALRDGIFDMLHLRKSQRKKIFLPFTAGLLALITGIALKITNLGAVVGFSGALTATALIYVIPAMINVAQMAKNRKCDPGVKKYRVLQNLNYFIAVFGGITGLFGVGVYILKSFK